MSRQVNFYMLPEDEAAFMRCLPQPGVYCITRESSFGISETLNITEAGLEGGGRTVYLLREIDLVEVVYTKLTGERWIVDIDRSPAVEFSRSHLNGQTLSRARFYFTTGYFERNGDWVEKPAEFQKWGNHLLRWIRTHYRRHPELGVYVGARAWQWVLEQGGYLRAI